MVRPNFDEQVRIVGTNLVVTGVSGETEDIVTIRVVLAQEDNTGGGPAEFVKGRVDGLDPQWQATLPLGDFKVGPAVAFGTELRKMNFLTLTWTQPVQIVK
jgi:hypothetical protein